MTTPIEIRNLRDDVRALLEQRAYDQAAALLGALHAADSAEVLSEFEPEDVQQILNILQPERSADIFIEFDEDDQVRVAEVLEPETLVEILDEMAPDDAADVLGELEPEQAAAALGQLEEADEIRELLEYEEDSAGGLMSSHIMTLRASSTVRQVIDLLRKIKPDEETIYYLFVVDEQERLVGVVSLRQLIVADPVQQIREIMSTEVIKAHVEADQEECARLLSRYDLLALPIVDDDERLIGAITADDIIDVIEEEATEDIYRLANLDVEEDVEDSLWRSARRRLFWLMVNLPTAILAGWVASQFEDTVGKITALVAFMPIVAGMGGNAGIQSLTLIVRSLALGEVAPGRGLRALGREFAIGCCNGIVLGTALSLLGMWWQGNPLLGLIVGAAMVLNLTAAAIAGTVVPLTLKALHIDPALASGVIVTTVTDVTGYTCLLGLATLLLPQLQGLG